MRALLPRPVPEASVADVYGDLVSKAAAATPDRPYLLLNMVSSADGAISVDGVSAGLSGSADKEVFFYLRSVADVILVGAATARAENYGSPKLAPELVARRLARGQSPRPRIAVVTRSMKLDWSARLFTESSADSDQQPLVVCPAQAPAAEQEHAGRVAHLIVAGETDIDLADAMAQLAGQGVRLVLCEGGPTLNGLLLSSDLVDELCLTLSPALVGGQGSRISGWRDARPPLSLELLTLAEDEGVLMSRYRVGGRR